MPGRNSAEARQSYVVIEIESDDYRILNDASLEDFFDEKPSPSEASGGS
jgi:hypothetical protein